MSRMANRQWDRTQSIGPIIIARVPPSHCPSILEVACTYITFHSSDPGQESDIYSEEGVILGYLQVIHPLFVRFRVRAGSMLSVCPMGTVIVRSVLWFVEIL